jgi:hypothetical protein
MATKKNIKPISGKSQQEQQDHAIYGSPTRYVGSKNSTCSCANCGKLMVKGMVRVKNNSYYCSARCASIS